jgi:hypothetical protein
METGILKMSIVGVETDLSGNDLGLGIWEKLHPSEVLHLRSFTYDNKTWKIVQEQVKKVLVTEGAPISVVTHVAIMGYVREGIVVRTMASFVFMNDNLDNIEIVC